MVKTETQNHPLGELERTDTKNKRLSIFSGAPTFSKLNLPRVVYPPAPGRQSMATEFSTPDNAGHLEFLPLPPSIFKNGTQNSSNRNRTTKFETSPMQLGRKDSKDQIPKNLIEDQRAMF
jgi:hypothetical protein